MNNVFFGENGLTSTSANYYANIAQEMVQSTIERLNSVKFYQIEVSSIAGGDKQLMSIGQTSLDFIKGDLKRVSEMNSFCAWIREAIKKKEELSNKVNMTSITDWAAMVGRRIPSYPDYPNDVWKITEKTVLETWDTNKRNKYLRLEAFAATYGKYIHLKGAFSNARKEVYAAANNPIYKEGSGRDLLLYHQTPTIELEKIDVLFMELQDTYRSYEKELNAMKAELKEEVNRLSREAEIAHQNKLQEHKKSLDEYNIAMADLKSSYNNWITSEQERISKLKIVLPPNLLEIFEEVKKQGDSSK